MKYLLLFILFSLSLYAKQQTKTVKCESSVIFTYTWDDENISVEKFTSALKFEPFCNQDIYNSIVFNIEACDKEDSPDYRKCNDNQIGSDNFIYNGNITLRMAKTKIDNFRKKAFPEELEPIKEHQLIIFDFKLWVAQTMLNFIEKKDISVLQTVYRNNDITVDPTKSCKNIIDKIIKHSGKTFSKPRGSKEWEKCIHKDFISRVHDTNTYGAKIWGMFLKKYEITEREEDLK